MEEKMWLASRQEEIPMMRKKMEELDLYLECAFAPKSTMKTRLSYLDCYFEQLDLLLWEIKVKSSN